MRKHALIVGAAIAASAAITVIAQTAPAPMPKDPCALLTAKEIQPLAQPATVGDGLPGTVASMGSITCNYSWNGGAPGADFQVHVMVTEAAKAFPGMSTTLLKQAMYAKVKGAGAEVPGIGDAATFISETPTQARGNALIKGLVVQVDLDGPNARLKKDQIIALLKIAAGRV
jgi:hypothetical protein